MQSVMTPADNVPDSDYSAIRALLSGGDRRGIAQSNRARTEIERNPALVTTLAALTDDPDWLVTQRALDLLEKIARDHPARVEPHKRIFIGPLERRPTLRPIVQRHLRKFEASSSKALLARARHIRARLAKSTAK